MAAQLLKKLYWSRFFFFNKYPNKVGHHRCIILRSLDLHIHKGRKVDFLDSMYPLNFFDNASNLWDLTINGDDLRVTDCTTIGSISGHWMKPLDIPLLTHAILLEDFSHMALGCSALYTIDW